MKFLKFRSFGNKLNFWVSITLVVIILTLSAITIKNYDKYIVELSDYSMFEQVADFEHMLNLDLKKTQESVNISLNLAHNFLHDLGKIEVSEDSTVFFEATNQITKTKHPVHVSKWEINGQPIQLDYTIVDQIKKQSVETATIFQKIPQGYLRVSTNVLKQNDERAVGTFIPNDSPVIKAIEKGKTFKGRAYVVNAWYLTAYEPILIDGKVEGILYVGVKDPLLENLRETLSQKTYFKTGYPYIVDSKGDFLLHPVKEGANVAGYDFFERMKPNKDKAYKMSYEWEGKDKYQFYKFYAPLNAFIAITIYKDDLFAVSRAIKTTTIFGIVMAIIIFVFVSKLIINKIVRSLKKGIAVTQNIASGNLNNDIKIPNTNDEVASFTKALYEMNTNLKNIILNIRQTALSVSEASTQLNSESEQLSQNSTEQSASVEEVSASIEEFAANVQNNADNSNQTQSHAKESTEGIIHIKTASQQSMESVNMITDKIQIINDIATQTNILALNAAVEAARAGEHGKGFAVVAAEVRKLAEKSKIAADEIIILSENSRKDTEKAYTLLNEVLPKLEKTTELIGEITAASLEQHSGVNQINNAMTQISTATQGNASSTEEMARNSEQLALLAKKLDDAVSFFSIIKSAKKVQVTQPTPQLKQTEETSIKQNTKQNEVVKIDMQKEFKEESVELEYESYI